MKEYLESLARGMRAEGVMSGDRTVTFVVDDPKDGRVRMKLTARGRSVVLECLSGPSEGRTAVIADCLHLIS